MSFSLSELTIYPIKSIQGVTLESSRVEYAGLSGDRRFMLVTPEGQFISGREYPSLTLVTALELDDARWQLNHPETVESCILDKAQFSPNYKDVVVWDSKVHGQKTHKKADAWFSSLIKEPVELMYFGERSQRHTGRRPEMPVAFADGYPFLLTTQASLDELNRTCTRTIDMAQFRPNLVIQGNKAFEEDSWKRIHIGEVEFENVKPCIRCIFTTLHPTTAVRVGKGEPLKTLAKFRFLSEKEGITFGVNMIALNTGMIHLNDPVEVLEYQEPDHYIDRR
ncbi:MOSC domain-containing protein [Marinomonas sp. IMCC 4694]|uniref:MOSC domain-containing protein n=1 Tax=Marinomonas sp. IMCC 4694 TaxID=2605432 RepID=UPI0011E7515C|nr:MOSC domain-containing protein [Marinomonas sp. IMCC 4694]TYL47788.1 MOSC domain-containing protein [Marinomonas sp. IMCC 4694]